MSGGTAPEPPLDEIFRSEWRRIVAVLARLLGDLDRAEECAQESLVAALERWPVAGVPENPGAWLMTTARNRALDLLRTDARGRAREDRLETEARLESYPLLAATRADFLRRLGRFEEAIDAYRRALGNTRNEPERRYLEGRVAQCKTALE